MKDGVVYNVTKEGVLLNRADNINAYNPSSGGSPVVWSLWVARASGMTVAQAEAARNAQIDAGLQARNAAYDRAAAIAKTDMTEEEKKSFTELALKDSGVTSDAYKNLVTPRASTSGYSISGFQPNTTFDLSNNTPINQQAVKVNSILSSTPEGSHVPTAQDPKLLFTNSYGAKVMRTYDPATGGYNETTISAPKGKNSFMQVAGVGDVGDETRARFKAESRQADIDYRSLALGLPQASAEQLVGKTGNQSFSNLSSSGLTNLGATGKAYVPGFGDFTLKQTNTESNPPSKQLIGASSEVFGPAPLGELTPSQYNLVYGVGAVRETDAEFNTRIGVKTSKSPFTDMEFFNVKENGVMVAPKMTTGYETLTTKTVTPTTLKTQEMQTLIEPPDEKLTPIGEFLRTTGKEANKIEDLIGISGLLQDSNPLVRTTAQMLNPFGYAQFAITGVGTVLTAGERFESTKNELTSGVLSPNARPDLYPSFVSEAPRDIQRAGVGVVEALSTPDTYIMAGFGVLPLVGKSVFGKTEKIVALNSESLLQTSGPAPSSVMENPVPKVARTPTGATASYENFGLGDNLIHPPDTNVVPSISSPRQPLLLYEGGLPDVMSGETYRPTPTQTAPKISSDYLSEPITGTHPSDIAAAQKTGWTYPKGPEQPWYSAPVETPNKLIPYESNVKWSSNVLNDLKDITDQTTVKPMGDTLFGGQTRGNLYAVEAPSLFEQAKSKIGNWWNPETRLTSTEPSIKPETAATQEAYANFGLGDNLIHPPEEAAALLRLQASSPEPISGANYVKFSETAYPPRAETGNVVKLISDDTLNPKLNKKTFGLFSPEGDLLAHVDVRRSATQKGTGQFSLLGADIEGHHFGRELLVKLIPQEGITEVVSNGYTQPGRHTFNKATAELGFEKVGRGPFDRYVARENSVAIRQPTALGLPESNAVEVKTSINWPKGKAGTPPEFEAGTKAVEPPKPPGKLVGTYQVDFSTRKFNQAIEQTNPYTKSQFQTDITGHVNLFGENGGPKSLDIKQIQMSEVEVAQVGMLDLNIEHGVSGAMNKIGPFSQVGGAPKQNMLPKPNAVPDFEPSAPVEPSTYAQGPGKLKITKSYTSGTVGGKPTEAYGESVDLLSFQTPVGEAKLSTGTTSAIEKGKLVNPVTSNSIMFDVRGTKIRFGGSEPAPINGEYTMKTGAEPPEAPAGPLKVGTKPAPLMLPEAKPNFDSVLYTGGPLATMPSIPKLGFNTGAVINLGGEIAAPKVSIAPSTSTPPSGTKGAITYSKGGMATVMVEETQTAPPIGNTKMTTAPPQSKMFTSEPPPQGPSQRATPEFTSLSTMPPTPMFAFSTKGLTGTRMLVGRTSTTGQMNTAKPTQTQVPKTQYKTATNEIVKPMETTAQKPQQKTMQKTMQQTMQKTMQRQPQTTRTATRQLTRTMQKTAQDTATPRPPPEYQIDKKHPPFTPPNLKFAFGVKTRKFSTPKFNLNMGGSGNSNFLADFISSDISILKYGRATSAGRGSALYKIYGRNLLGFNPTVELGGRRGKR
jgi:hypothetical protein